MRGPYAEVRMLSPINILIVSSALSVSCGIDSEPYYLCDDYSNEAREYIMKVNPPIKTDSDILYELILRELESSQ